MIIQHRSAGSLSYGTDPVAQSLRSVIAAPAPDAVSRRAAAPPAAAGALDLVRLYPAIYGPAAGRRAAAEPAARVLAVRASILGSLAAALLFIIRH